MVSMTKQQILTAIIDPTRRNIGNVGVAMVKAAAKS
jgi:hypothetical protein